MSERVGIAPGAPGERVGAEWHLGFLVREWAQGQRCVSPGLGLAQGSKVHGNSWRSKGWGVGASEGGSGLDGAGLSHDRLMRMKWGICRGDTPHPCSSFIQAVGWLSRRPFVLIILGFQFCGKLR